MRSIQPRRLAPTGFTQRVILPRRLAAERFTPQSLQLLWLASTFLFAHAAAAQPSLDTLWPNRDGTRWTYQISVTDAVFPAQSFVAEATLQFSGEIMTAGGMAQVLLGAHPVPAGKAPAVALDPVRSGKAPAVAIDPLLDRLWRARPDLRAAIVARLGPAANGGTTGWYPLLLHYGYFMKGAANIQMWQPDIDHPTWTYLTSNLLVGAQFTQQLIPELAIDVFLHGTVEAVDASVQTEARRFDTAVRMGYVIDYGWTTPVDDAGNPHGRIRSETRGHVHFVPGVGPVEMLEEFIRIAEFQCDATGCPPPSDTDELGLVQVTIRLSLTASTVAVQQRTWSEVKSLFRN